ncbi:Imm1 family immunity protein [Paractinoplanes hotanensis]|uniref:Imm1 family immunity protein n=1 Tax=Paractinoplanes hotanensis TaxID=2906497 RepID=A0ABT0Y730_9ACTN|nr:Imm1 family immunity protein [Actinoplanes hotanensis]MCM4081124.1 Imm1 family immunity protein [Actinoplanes hotanensis]
MLHIRIGSDYHYATERAEMAELIAMVLRGGPVNASTAFSFADRRHTAETRDWWLDNVLQVGVNPATGYGGLTWHVTPARADRSGDAKDAYCWVTDNPDPPETDPVVLSDPGAPVCYDRRSTLPIADIRAALEEFCRSGTGDRPQSVRWVRGDLNGERLDERQAPRW